MMKDRQVSFAGMSLNKHFKVASIERPLPEFRMASSEVNGADGEEFESLTVGPREVTMKLMVRGKTEREVQDAARTLMDMMLYRKPVPLRISDERDKEGNQLIRYAVPRGSFESEDYRHAGVWTVSFAQPDPYLYGKERSVVLKANESKPIWYSGEDAFPTFELRPASGRTAAISVRDLTNSTSFTIHPNTTFRHKVTVDAKRLSVSSDDDVTLGTDSRIFPISGNVTLLCNVPATVTWRERFL